MNIKVISVFLIIFFLAITAVSATTDNTTNTEEILTVNLDENQISTVESESISVSEENTTLTVENEEELAAPMENNILTIENKEPIIISKENTTIIVKNNEILGACLNTAGTLSSSSEPILSVSQSQDNTVLTSIYGKVYSTKVWKTITLISFKVKKSLPKYERDKIIQKKYKIALKKVNKNYYKFTNKGWTYERCLWTWQVGSYQVNYQYSIQFSKRVYYTVY